MANAGLVFLWNDVKTGREKLAGELFNSTLAFYEKKVKEGVVESYEPAILSRHGGTMNGFIVVRGEVDKLTTLRQSNDFKEMETKALHCLSGFGVVEAALGKEVGEVMKRWASHIPR
jgi:hypothetical protein